MSRLGTEPRTLRGGLAPATHAVGESQRPGGLGVRGCDMGGTQRDFMFTFDVAQQ